MPRDHSPNVTTSMRLPPPDRTSTLENVLYWLHAQMTRELADRIIGDVLPPGHAPITLRIEAECEGVAASMTATVTSPRPVMATAACPPVAGLACSTCGGANIQRAGTCHVCSDCGESVGGCS